MARVERRALLHNAPVPLKIVGKFPVPYRVRVILNQTPSLAVTKVNSPYKVEKL